MSGPKLDGADWRARAVFLGPAQQPGGAEQPVDSPVAFRDVTSKNVSAIRPRVAVPVGVSPGDGLVLFVTVNAAGATMSEPAGVTGWQRIGDLESGTMRTYVYQRVATGDEDGLDVMFTLARRVKVTMQLLVYAGTATQAPVVPVAAGKDAGTATHTTPRVDVTVPGSWVLSYWADKSSSTTGWTAPQQETARAVSLGSLSGRVTSLAADSGGPVAVGRYGGLTATADAESSRGTMWSLVLAPALS
ncbi:hypothetical protein BH24BAC1_BH24BAC1_38470 [soil metagenome]